jgi:hypothetical protein
MGDNCADGIPLRSGVYLQVGDREWVGYKEFPPLRHDTLLLCFDSTLDQKKDDRRSQTPF